MTASTRIVNQNWWITTLMINGHEYCPPLTKDIKCDVLIVGGGFSGVSAAAEFLRTIKTHDIECGLLKQDSLFLGLGSGGTEVVESERECRESVGFKDQKTYDENQLKQILGAQGYTAEINATSRCRAVSAT